MQYLSKKKTSVNGLLRLIGTICLLCLMSGSAFAGELKPVDLTCESLEQPLGVDARQPRLSWRIHSEVRGEKQTAYRVLVASSAKLLEANTGDLWDSGKVESEQSINLTYRGEALQSRRLYHWKVKLWGADGAASDWSEASTWRMGMLDPDDSTAEWIQSDLELFHFQKELKKLPKFVEEDRRGPEKRADSIKKQTNAIREAPAVWMRKEFAAEKKLRQATAFISGLGFYELYLNGAKIDDHYFNIAAADYEKTVPYLVHDLTESMKQGANAVGVILGNGHFNPIVPFMHREYASDFIDTPRLWCEILLEYEDGSSQVLRTDSSWRFTTDGPIRFNSMRSGEIHDARRELGNWSSVGYDDNQWKPARKATAPRGRMRWQAIPPVRVLDEIPAVAVEPVEGGGWLFDIGEQNAGWARLTLRGEPGQEIRINYRAGKLSQRANIYLTLGPYQTCTYICKGEGEEVFEPRFSYNGFQYVEVQGLKDKPELEDCIGLRVASDMEVRGHFSCSDERLNALQEVHLRTIDNYYVQMPGDPVREKSNWTQDIQTHSESVGYNYDIHEMYAKWQQDFLDHIQPDGFVPAIVPSCFAGRWINGPWWGGMIVYNPWQLYQFYGDLDVLTRSYPEMKRYLGYLDSIASDHVVRWGLGDWQDAAVQKVGYGKPKSTTVPYTSTCAYFLYADILERTARLLGKSDEAAAFKSKKEAIRKAIHRDFYDAATGRYDKGSQTAQVLALRLGIVEAQDRGKVIDALAQQIAEDDSHLSSGFVGLPFLLIELTECGLGDLAWKIATQESYPGWFDMVFNRKNTAFMEAWDGGKVQMPSLAAPIGAWFYRSLGGIRTASPGFKSFIIQPYTGTLEWVKCSYESPYGKIVSNWRKEGAKLIMEISVPPNSTATVYVPSQDPANVTESGHPAAKANGVKEAKPQPHAAVYHLESGHYKFVSPLHGIPIKQEP